MKYAFIRHKYYLRNKEIEETIILMEHDAQPGEGNGNVVGSVPDDPNDEMFLPCVPDDQLDVIVSGDHQLLELGSDRNSRSGPCESFWNDYSEL